MASGWPAAVLALRARVAWVVATSEVAGLRRVAAALSNAGLRRALLAFLLPRDLPRLGF